ncbi:MAG: branched-chain amino acid ABC transporter substrate-binding protein [Elusimicrobia bacterium]|nr:branched-chain amino acid ABC transporter substrate-binding protein [Elusimicrobiota bacterium]
MSVKVELTGPRRRLGSFLAGACGIGNSAGAGGTHLLTAGAVVSALALGWAGCVSRRQAVRIAVALPLTGDLGSEGAGLRRAVDLALEEANASGKLPFRVEAVAFDDRADPEEARNVANLVVADPRIVAVVGHYSSDCSASASQVYARAPLAMISPASTNPEVTRRQLRPDWPGARVVFRLVPTDDLQGSFAAEYLRGRLRQERMAVLHDGTLYGQGLAEEFRRTFRRLGGKVLAEAVVKVGSRDISAALESLQAPGLQGVFFGGRYPEAGLILRGLSRLRLRLLFCSGDGARTPVLFDVAGGSADGAYLTTAGAPVETLPGARDFIGAYRARWGDEGPRPFDHYGYEAARIILEALQAVGPERARVLKAVRRTRHAGLLGVTSFDEKGDVRSRRIAMTRARSADRSFPVVP